MLFYRARLRGVGSAIKEAISSQAPFLPFLPFLPFSGGGVARRLRMNRLSVDFTGRGFIDPVVKPFRKPCAFSFFLLFRALADMEKRLIL